MRFLSPGSCFLVSILAMASCQPIVVPTKAVPTHSPAQLNLPVSLDQPVIDLGNVRQGETKTFVVLVHNHSNKTLRFQGFRTACSCSNLVVAQKELNPGSEVKVEGVFRGQGAYGPFSRTIEILWGDEKPAVLTLTGEVYRDLVIEPEGLLLRPEPLTQLADEGQIVIRNRGLVPVRMKLGDVPSGLVVEAESSEIAPQGFMTLKIKALPQLLVREQFQLVAGTDHQQERRLDIPVLVQPRNSIQVQPLGFHWGLLSTRDWQARMPLEVKLWGPALSRCRITRVELPDYLKQVNEASESNVNQQLFRFTTRSNMTPADLNGCIVFHLEVPGQSAATRLTIPVSGLLRDSQSLRSMR